MTPARWQRIEDLVSQALELSENRREDFLRIQCADDRDLINEVNSLIDAYERPPASSSPFAAVREALGAIETEYYLGRMIGKYRVEEFLGRGGTSTVYRARDAGTGETIALKILSPDACSPEETGCSAVEHPNVARVLELIGDSDVRAIVMEHIDGETVAQRLRRAAIGPREIVQIATQAAAGLAAAHELGISHGDVKPANLMIDSQGTVKVLDFGCRGTTAAYLAPERVAGKPPDPRSDVFSFGVTLYEMATGQRDFRMPVRAHVHGPLGALIERCVDQDPQRRYADAAELVRALNELKPPTLLDAFRSGMTRKSMVVAGTIFALLATCLALLPHVRKQPSRQYYSLTDNTTLVVQPALSPDGKLVAYAANRDGGIGLDIWLQHVREGTPRRLTMHPADDLSPSFSPDGKWIVFGSDRDGGGIYRVAVNGGIEARIGAAGFRPQYSPDGKWISYRSVPRGSRSRGSYMPRRIDLLPVSGGAPIPFAAGLSSAHSPVWSPDGKHILFVGQSREGDADTWWVGKLDGSAPLGVSASPPGRASGYVFQLSAMLPQCWLPDGRIVFQHHQGASITLRMVSFSIQQRRFTEVPQALTSGSGQAVDPACGAEGELLYANLQARINLWSVALGEDRILRPVTRTQGLDTSPSVTGNGNRLLYVNAGAMESHMRRHDLERGDDHAFGGSKPRNLWLRQSGDGSRIATLEDRRRRGKVRITDAGGELVQELPDVFQPQDFSPDAKFVLARSESRPAAILLHRAEGNGGSVLLRHPVLKLHHARISPDGRWIVFSAQRAEEPPQSFVVHFRHGVEIPVSDWMPASTGDAVNAEWSPDGELLYFLSERDGYLCLWDQRLNASTKRPLGEARPIHHFHHFALNLWDVSHNHRALAVARDRVILNVVSRTSELWLAR